MIEGDKEISLGTNSKSSGTIRKRAYPQVATHMVSDGEGTQSRASQDDQSGWVGLKGEGNP